VNDDVNSRGFPSVGEMMQWRKDEGFACEGRD